jgi:GT2 family glycosyltransferase
LTPGPGLVRPPLISAVVVRYADDPRAEACLEALKLQEGVDLEVILVENGSRRAAGMPAEPWKAPGGAVRAVESVTREANPGFAAAFNEACGRARGGMILSATPDTRLDPDAVRRAREGLLADPGAGAVAFRLWRPGRQVLDSAGIVLSPVILRARDRGRGEPGEGSFLEPCPVDAACLAAALLSREALDASRDGAGEILDRRYFAYQEDVDLGWRMRRAGFRILYEPKAVGEHERRWREGGRREIPVSLRRASLRNRWFTILKNVSWPGLVWRLPFLAAFELLLFLKLLVTEPAVVPAFGSALAGIPATLARRGRSRTDDAARNRQRAG